MIPGSWLTPCGTVVITLIATAVAVLVGVYYTRKVGNESVDLMRGHSDAMKSSFRSTEELINKITGLFALSQMVGIETAYENREVALLERDPSGEDVQSFLGRIKDDPKLIVVGSSLLGLKTYVPRLSQYIRARNNKGYETKFLLTCPCYSNLREDQEKRSNGQIRTEIQETIRFLEKDCGLPLDKCLRFYKGTPTCFMIVVSNYMLLNPYPYQAEAFKAFCLEVRRLETSSDRTDPDRLLRLLEGLTDWKRFQSEIEEAVAERDWARYDYSTDVGPGIFGQFYWYHYFLPWFSERAVTYEEFCDVCAGKKCPSLETGYSGSCPIKAEEVVARHRESDGYDPTASAASSEGPVSSPSG